MAPMTAPTEAATRPIHLDHILPNDRNDWSSGAQNAYGHVLGELDAWSRHHDTSKKLNSWIAEEAVRQSW